MMDDQFTYVHTGGTYEHEVKMFLHVVLDIRRHIGVLATSRPFSPRQAVNEALILRSRGLL